MNDYTNLSPRGNASSHEVVAENKVEPVVDGNEGHGDESRSVTGTVVESQASGVLVKTAPVPVLDESIHTKKRYDETKDPWESEDTSKSDLLEGEADEQASACTSVKGDKSNVFLE